MDKKQLRAEVKEKKRAMTAQQIEKTSAVLARMLYAHPAYQKAKSIYGYFSYNQEVRMLPILEQARRDGKRVAVPKVYGEEMRFLWMDDLTAVAPGLCGIPEPVFDAPVAEDETALVILPGLAFDPAGRRCGYGGGFYDKYLQAHPNHPTVALCYGFQMFDRLETEDHDLPVDVVLAAEVVG